MRSKLFVVILTMVILVGLFTLMLTNSEVRENIRNGLDAFGNNFNSEDSVNEEIDLQADTQVFEDGSAMLTDDSAIVEKVDISSKITGTGPFDDNDEPGNDSSESNNIVRSFDTVTWNLEATTALNRTGHGSEDVNTYSQFRGGVIYVEAKLPEENAGLMKWSLDDMTWAGDTGVLSDDGLTFTAQYEMSDEIITVPGKQTLSLVLKLDGVGNGTKLTPTFKLWMQGNETNPDNEGYEAKEIQDTDPVTVSAKAGYNIKLSQNNNLKERVTVNFEDGNGDVSGRMYGFGILLQLYNEDVEKGLKGLEYPQGDITFDIKTKLETVETIDGKQITTDITDKATPQLWNYKINTGNDNENPSYGNIPNRNMFFVYASSMMGEIPLAINQGTSGRDNSIYDSGNILMEQEGSIIKTTINDYDFDGIFPEFSKNKAKVYGENIGCFSAGYFQIFVPDNEETTDNSKTYNLTIEDTNIKLNTISNQEVINQVITNDDKIYLQHYYLRTPTYNSFIDFTIDNTNNQGRNGDTALEKGSQFVVNLYTTINNADIEDAYIYSMDKIFKFDGEGLEPISVSKNDSMKMDFNIYYLTKKDGSNWTSQEEMCNTSDFEDFNIYNNKDEIPEGFLCIGILLESKEGGMATPTYPSNGIYMKIKETAQVNKTYGMTVRSIYWDKANELDREIYTVENKEISFDEYPTPTYDTGNRQYIKSEYDKNGQIIEGTHKGSSSSPCYNGNTVLALGTDLSGSINAIDEEKKEKLIYDLGKNENIVTYSVEPKLDKNEALESQISNVNLKAEVTMPDGLTYIPGSSNYGEPVENIKNTDGSTTLVWHIYGVTSGDTIEAITFQAQISEQTKNETEYETKLVVSELIAENEESKLGYIKLENRQSSKTIKIVKLASYRIYQETDTQIIESNGEIKYKLTFQNSSTTSMPDFQVLDILPYSGDGRGTAYNGTYTLKDVKVTQTLGGSVIENSNLKLYTTTNIDARKITPKDEGIGVSEIWIEKTIGEAINELVTVIALKGEVANNATVEIEITLQTSNNRGGDIYYNQATAQTSKNTEVITTSNVKTEVVKRQISGMIWYDTNENGIKDEEENYANRIEVELKKADGSKAQDYNGNEIENILTDSNGTYTFSNLPMGEYIVEIKTEDKYKLTQANVGSNKEINSKFEETEEGAKQSYTITNLNGTQSPEILENNVNAGLVVKDAKIIVNYLIEDATPDTDEDNTELVASKEITTYKKEGETYKYKIGDSYNTYAEEVEDYVILRNSGNTEGTLEAETIEVTYYYAYNKQDIEITKVWEDNGNSAQKRPTSIKVELKNGVEVVKEITLTSDNKITDEEKAQIEGISSTAEVWRGTIEDVEIYDDNVDKIEYTIDEKEAQGSLESYNKTINGMQITNTFTQNTQKIEIPVTKVWDDNQNKAGKRPTSLTIILKREIGDTYVEVTRQTINGTDNKGSNINEWQYTFTNIPKYDENNNEINYKVEEIVPDFYTSKVETVENTNSNNDSIEFKITNTFEVPTDTINIEVTKIWDDNNNRAGKRPQSTTLVLTGKNAEGEEVVAPQEITLTSANKIGESLTEENIWKGTIQNLKKYDENANLIDYELSEENLKNIFYTEANTTINQHNKTVTNRFVVPEDKIEIEVNKKWTDNNNELGRRPTNVTLFLTGNNQEYEVTLTESNKNENNETIWTGKIGNLPKYNVNGDEITYTLDERPIASEFYTKTGIDQESKTVTNTFAIPTESVQIPVTILWEDNNNIKGHRPENAVLQIKDKRTGTVVSEQMIAGNRTTNDGWNYTFEVPKYNEQGEIVEYEIGEKDLENKFYPSSSVIINQEQKTITNKFVVPDEKITVDVRKEWIDTAEQQNKRPTEVTVIIKNEETEVGRQKLNELENWSYTFTNLPKYDSDANEINYTVEELETNKFYSNTSITGNMKDGYVITNTFTRPTDTIDITVNKQWADNNNEAKKRPESITLKVTGNGETRTQEITELDMWKYTFTGLPKYDENGNEIEYIIDEEGTNSNFYQKTDVNQTTRTITNTFQVPVENITVVGKIEWDDNNNTAQKRPTSATLQIKNGDNLAGTGIVNAKNNWTYEFSVPKYDNLGNEIKYTIDQVDLENIFYNKNITGDMTNGFTVTNKFAVPNDKIELTVTKQWSDNEFQEDKRPETIKINVLGENQNIEQSYDLNVKGGETTYTFEGLKKYNDLGNEIQYTVEEQGTNKFYSNTSITGNMKDGYVITNTFTRPTDTIDITVNKQWADNNNEAKKRPESITLKVTGNGETRTQEITALNETKENTNIWAYTFTGLPKYDENGDEIEYIIDEEGTNSYFYRKTDVNQTTRTITNTFQVPVENITIVGKIEWDDNNNEAQKRPTSATLQIKNGDKLEETGIVNPGNNWTYEFSVPKYDSLGNEIKYTVDQVDLENIFYNKKGITGDMTNGFIITNEFVVPDDKTELTVTKQWSDNEFQKDRRPEKVKINVLGENQKVEQSYELNVKEGETTYTFKGLKKYNDLGNEIQYTVEEQGTNEFYSKVDISGNMKDGYVITNTFTRPTDTIQIIVNKIWKDNDVQAERRPESIMLVVKNGDQEVKTAEITKDNLVEGTTNQWSTTINDLPKYDDNGKVIQYTVEEREVNAGDLKFYKAEEKTVQVEDKQATIRNTFVKPTDTTEITVTKVWDDENNINGKRPKSIMLVVKNGDQEVKTVEMTNQWSTTISDLPKYNDNGQEIQYTVEEKEVKAGDLKFYTNTGVTGDVTSGYTITNKFTIPEETIELKVTKKWIDNDIQMQRRPEKITINVIGENGKIVDSYELDTKTETSYTFTNLPKYNNQGNEIQYTVEEQGTNKFYSNVSISGNVQRGFIITNTFTKPTETKDVEVTKVWDDNNNESEKRPESIMMQLKNGSVIVKTQQVTGDTNANEWKFIFTQVDKYDENGQEIQYTVDETEVNKNDLQFYTSKIEGTTITNTFTQNTETVNVEVTKIWEDNEEQAQRRPESVIIVLKANKEEKQRYELSSSTANTANENTWTYTFTNLPKYDEHNNIITYTVEEQEKNTGDLKFYTSKIEGTTITNTFTKPKDTISIDVNKNWEDQGNIYNKRPVSVRIQVKNGGVIVGSQVITKEDGWKARFTGLPKYNENGQEIVYTVDEEEVLTNDLFNYEKEVGAVTNKEGTTDQKEATITNTITKIPSTVVVKYVDKYTGEEISERRTKEGIVGDPYDVTEDKKEITGYTIIEEPAEKTGTFTSKPQEKIYYYAKNTKVTVKYLEKDDTPEDISNNNVLLEQKEILGYEGLSYTTEKETINGYTFVEATQNTEGTMGREEIVVIYYYSPNTTVTVKYLDQDNKEIAPEKVINGYVGEKYSTEKQTIEGYTFIKATENIKGTMTKDPIEVIYYYAQNTKVVVKYLEQGTNIELAPEKTINGYVGKEYTTEKENITNYTFVEATQNTKGKMTKDPIEVIYYYAQKTKITIQHIDRETGEILKQKIETGKVGDIVQTHAEDFEGYVLVEEPEETNITMDKTGKQLVKYYYAHISKGVIEKHIDSITGEMLYSKEHQGNEGDHYKISSKEFAGYDLVETKLPENAEGEMTQGLIEVKYYYIKQARVIVKYLEQDNTPEDTTDNKELAKEEIIEGHENDSYETKAKDIKGYNLVETPENAKGTMTVTKNTDGTLNVETEVIYYYKKQAGGVVENHIDITTNKVLATETHSGTVGDKYSITSKDIDGYDIVETMLPENAQGTMTEETIVVNYYYIKQTQVKVVYIDKLTGNKLDEEIIAGHVGDKYITEEKIFDGYDLVEKPSNSKGEMIEEEIVVKYYYERKAEVEIKYLEKGTNYEIQESEKIEGYIGDRYEAIQKEIPYYNYIEKTENYKGTMVEDKTTVIFYYEKQVFNLKVDTWVSNVKVNGISHGGQSIEEKDELYKVEIHRKQTDTADMKVTYKIRVTNTGEVEGTAREIVAIIPAGYSYHQEDNKIRWEQRNGALVTDAIKDETIQTGEYKEIEIVLRWDKGEYNFGQKDNLIILNGEGNPAGYEDTNKDDNNSTSSMIIAVETGSEIDNRVIIMIGALVMLIVLAIIIKRKI